MEGSTLHSDESKHQPSPGGSVDPELRRRIGWLEQYITENVGFVCEHARAALLARTVTIETLPGDVPTNLHENVDLETGRTAMQLSAIQESIHGSIGPFLSKERSAIMYVEHPGAGTHYEAHAGAWVMYSEFYVALYRHEHPEARPEQIRPYARDAAQFFLKPEHFKNYIEQGLLTFRGQNLHFVVMNPLYSTSPEIHPRFAPINVYVLTRGDDVTGARHGDQLATARIQDKILQRGPMYIGTLPYIMEGDDRYLNPEYIQLRHTLGRMQAKSAGLIEGDVDKMTLAVLRRNMRVHIVEAQRNLREMESQTMDGLTIAKILHELGFLKVDPSLYM